MGWFSSPHERAHPLGESLHILRTSVTNSLKVSRRLHSNERASSGVIGEPAVLRQERYEERFFRITLGPDLTELHSDGSS